MQHHQTPHNSAPLISIDRELKSMGSLIWVCLTLPPVINKVYSTALLFSIYHLSGVHSVTILKNTSENVSKEATP